MLAPDHWVPLTIYAHSNGLRAQRAALIAIAGGLAHFGGSLIAVVLAVVVGLAVSTSFSGFSNTIVGVSFLAVGVWKVASAYREHGPRGNSTQTSIGVKWLVVAATSSPELTIFPVLLAALVYGLGVAAATIAAFAFGTIASFVCITVAGVKGMGKFLRAPGREKQIDYAIGAVLLLLGLAVLGGA